MNVYSFQRLLEACDMYDNALTPPLASMNFYVCGKIRWGHSRGARENGRVQRGRQKGGKEQTPRLPCRCCC